MQQSFAATIAFALLAMGMAFLANLAVFVFTATPACAFGVILATGAAGLSYIAQSRFTVAEHHLAQHRKEAGQLVEFPDAYDQYAGAHQLGTMAQWIAVAFTICSLGTFVIGALAARAVS